MVRNGTGFCRFGASGLNMATWFGNVVLWKFSYGGWVQASCKPGLLWAWFGSQGGSSLGAGGRGHCHQVGDGAGVDRDGF